MSTNGNKKLVEYRTRYSDLLSDQMPRFTGVCVLAFFTLGLVFDIFFNIERFTAFSIPIFMLAICWIFYVAILISYPILKIYYSIVGWFAGRTK